MLYIRHLPSGRLPNPPRKDIQCFSGDSDLEPKIERATSLSWFSLGTMFGPAFGPLLGGIVVTYTSWRVIFWVQTALGALALLQATFVLHETLQYLRYIELRGQRLRPALTSLWEWSNPATVFKTFSEKNVACVVSSPLLPTFFILRHCIEPSSLHSKW